MKNDANISIIDPPQRKKSLFVNPLTVNIFPNIYSSPFKKKKHSSHLF